MELQNFVLLTLAIPYFFSQRLACHGYSERALLRSLFMSTTQSEILFQRALEKKKKDFPRLSVRWMATKLDVSHVYLSYILKGKRPVPVDMVDPLCEILDLDEESRAQIYLETFKVHGYRPTQKSTTVRIHGWSLVTLKDFELISRWEPMAILLVTHLKGYDGSLDFISSRLKLPKFFVQSVLDILHEKGFLVEVDGKLTASEKYYEFQSQSSKTDIRKYHHSVVSYARNLMEKKTDEKALERRHIVSGAFTCSKENALRLKMKINDFIKECIEEGAASSADDVYQLAVQLFPVTEPRG